MFNPPHPGTVLKEYLGDVSVTTAADHLGVTRAALSRILNGNAGISAEMALRLSDALGTSPELWTGMQAQYDLWQASKKPRRKLQRLKADRAYSILRHLLSYPYLFSSFAPLAPDL